MIGGGDGQPHPSSLGREHEKIESRVEHSGTDRTMSWRPPPATPPLMIAGVFGRSRSLPHGFRKSTLHREIFDEDERLFPESLYASQDFDGFACAGRSV